MVQMQMYLCAHLYYQSQITFVIFVRTSDFILQMYLLLADIKGLKTFPKPKHILHKLKISNYTTYFKSAFEYVFLVFDTTISKAFL